MWIEVRAPVEILHKLIELKPAQQVSSVGNQIAPNAGCLSKPDVKRLNEHVQQLITHPLFECYQLNQTDVMVIVELWRNHLDSQGLSLAWPVVCACTNIQRYDVRTCAEYLISLLERNIICFDAKMVAN